MTLFIFAYYSYYKRLPLYLHFRRLKELLGIVEEDTFLINRFE